MPSQTLRYAVPRRTVLLAIVMAGALALPGAVGAQAEPHSSALAFVQKLSNDAITQLTSADISDSDRVKRMRKLLADNFDVEAVGRFVLGPYYRQTTEAQFKEFLRLYQIYVAHNYAGLFKRYNGEKIEMNREQTFSTGDTVVYGVIRQTSGPPVNIELRVRKENGTYKVLDLKVEGVSMPLTHRKQFASVISQRGNRVAGLIDALRRATDRFEAETPSQ